MCVFIVCSIAGHAFKKESPSHQVGKFIIISLELLNDRRDEITFELRISLGCCYLQLCVEGVLLVDGFGRVGLFDQFDQFIDCFIEKVAVSHFVFSVGRKEEGKASSFALIFIHLREIRVFSCEPESEGCHPRAVKPFSDVPDR